jgi:hypothetical protein
LKRETVVGRVVRLDERKPDGEPLYPVSSNNIVTAQVEPHLMQTS